MNAIYCKNERNGDTCKRYLGAVSDIRDGDSVDFRCPACRGHLRNISVRKQDGRLIWESGIEGRHRLPEPNYDEIITLAEA